MSSLSSLRSRFRPYIDMTLAVMTAFGIHVRDCPIFASAKWTVPFGEMKAAKPCRFTIAAPQHYRAITMRLNRTHPPRAIFRRRSDYPRRSDRRGSLAIAFKATCLLRLPAKHGLRVRSAADHITVVTAAARNRRTHERHQRHGADARRSGHVCPRPTTIRGVAHIRHKETDRIHALATELRKLGAEVENDPTD